MYRPGLEVALAVENRELAAYVRVAEGAPGHGTNQGGISLGFWIYMLVMDLLIPAVMIGFGRRFMRKPPRKINAVFGYRTSMSMKNQDTWVFAHKRCGKIWFAWGWVLLFVSVVPLLFVVGQEERVVGAVGGAVCGVQLIFLIVSIVCTENALNKTFDSNGIRK